jgi:tetratricopeptide (TPR) repeat protein
LSEEEGLGGIAEMVFRELFENIDTRLVYMPLSLCVLFILAYPITQFPILLYFALGFALLAFVADWGHTLWNRGTPRIPTPTAPVGDLAEPSYRDQLFRHLARVQGKAVNMVERGKTNAARALTVKNLKLVDDALKTFPMDADFHALMGYTLKDIYQNSRNLLPSKEREAYLRRARESFIQALKLDPNNASAHNGMGNVLFYQHHFDEAIKEHEKALELADHNYPAAEHDKNLVIAVKKGEIPFEP